MDITVILAQGKVPVTVLKTHGNVDGSNYEQLIETAKDAISAGARNILLDLTDTEYMSTAGMVALQSITRLLGGEKLPDSQSGWDAIHDIDRNPVADQAHIKLLNPQPRVDRSLETIGFKAYYPIFTNWDEAIKSF
jgi:anti-anti-sigma regulatory factor